MGILLLVKIDALTVTRRVYELDKMDLNHRRVLGLCREICFTKNTSILPITDDMNEIPDIYAILGRID